ncbi:MAG: hypothetical protein N3G20_04890, partial [Verrucomicrobiae bacterium]|nr:hypothetical protein [Verrucomicrobiae bacterium]
AVIPANRKGDSLPVRPQGSLCSALVIPGAKTHGKGSLNLGEDRSRHRSLCEFFGGKGQSIEIYRSRRFSLGLVSIPFTKMLW